MEEQSSKHVIILLFMMRSLPSYIDLLQRTAGKFQGSNVLLGLLRHDIMLAAGQ